MLGFPPKNSGMKPNIRGIMKLTDILGDTKLKCHSL